MRMIFRCGVLVVAVTAAQLAFGQGPMARGMSSYHPYEIAGTYSHMLTDGSLGGRLSLNGFTASASANIISIGQATAEVGRYSGHGVALTSFLAGPQARFHIYRIQPFVRGLFGLTHTSVSSRSAGNSFTIAAGGGVNYLLSDRIAIRVLQVDYYRPYGGPYTSADFLRLAVGVGYQFGTR